MIDIHSFYDYIGSQKDENNREDKIFGIYFVFYNMILQIHKKIFI